MPVPLVLSPTLDGRALEDIMRYQRLALIPVIPMNASALKPTATDALNGLPLPLVTPFLK